MAPKLGGPLILLSPAKSLNFEAPLSRALAATTATQPQFLSQARELTAAAAALSKSDLKSLMGLSDSLAALNHARFSDFESQPSRMAIGAFEGQAYKGLSAATLAESELGYLQRSLRVLCGLYGVLRPYDEIRPYRMEMSTRMSCGASGNLYAYWGSQITDSLNSELDAIADSDAKFVLNIASQEYAKSVSFPQLRAPVITVNFPGPAVHAKTARGEMARFCAERSVCSAEQLKQFTGSKGEWRFVPSASSDATLVFHRGPASAAAPSAPATKGKAAAAAAIAPKARGAKREADGGAAPPARKARR